MDLGSESKKLRFEVVVGPNGELKPGPDGLPKIKPTAQLELVVRLDDIDDPTFMRRRLDVTERVLDVTQGVAVKLANAQFDPPSYATIKRSLRNPADYERTSRSDSEAFAPFVPKGQSDTFARVEPQGPIRVVYKLGERPKLMPVKVHLPDLGVTAQSLNNACTLLSEHFETERLSHTYSAFEVVFLRRGDNWIPLKGLT